MRWKVWNLCETSTTKTTNESARRRFLLFASNPEAILLLFSQSMAEVHTCVLSVNEHPDVLLRVCMLGAKGAKLPSML